jgi:hypothetical protein
LVEELVQIEQDALDLLARVYEGDEPEVPPDEVLERLDQQIARGDDADAGR